MEQLRFCGSLNIACGHASEQGFCTLTRCPRGPGRVPGHAEAPGANRAEGPAGRMQQCGRQYEEVNVQGLRGAHCVDQNGGREIHALRCGASAVQGPGGRGG